MVGEFFEISMYETSKTPSYLPPWLEKNLKYLCTKCLKLIIFSTMVGEFIEISMYETLFSIVVVYRVFRCTIPNYYGGHARLKSRARGITLYQDRVLIGKWYLDESLVGPLWALEGRGPRAPPPLSAPARRHWRSCVGDV